MIPETHQRNVLDASHIMTRKKRTKRSLDPYKGDLVQLFIPMYGMLQNELNQYKGKKITFIVVDRDPLTFSDSEDYDHICLMSIHCGVVKMQMWEYWDCDPVHIERL